MLLLQGDCLIQMKSLPSKSIDCFICDLPYGCLTTGNPVRRRFIGGVDTGTMLEGQTIGGCAWDIKIDLVQFWEQVKRLAKDDHTPVLMFCNTRFGNELINSNPAWFRYDLIWAKPNAVGFLLANKMPMRSHELIYVFSKKGAFYKRVDIEGDFSATSSGKGNAGGSVYGKIKQNNDEDRTGIRCVKSVVEITNKRGKGNHPTQKPAELYKWLLERYCREGGTVLDPTAGSFNSVFTADEMGLKAIGIEKDNNFFYKAIQNSIKRIIPV